MRDPTETSSFVTFMELAWPRHLRLAMLLTGDRLRAEDLLHDSLVKMYAAAMEAAQGASFLG